MVHNKLTVPKYDWAVAPFPKVYYPMYANEAENAQEVGHVLDVVREVIKEHRSKSPVAAMVVEPITFMGNHFASPEFYQSLSEICTSEGIALIVDESRTGVGITGSFWGHDHWYLDSPPDFVVFGNASQVNGYYSTTDYQPARPNSLDNIG